VKGGWEHLLVRAASWCIGESRSNKRSPRLPSNQTVSRVPTGDDEDTALPDGPRLLVAADACRQPLGWRCEFTPLRASSSQIRRRRCIRPQHNNAPAKDVSEWDMKCKSARLWLSSLAAAEVEADLQST
jgi:hypothetical protein